MDGQRRIPLRVEHNGDDHRYLTAWMDDAGNLHIDGLDIGPGTSTVSEDEEYEWFRRIDAQYLPRLAELLGGNPGEDLLDTLERDWSGPRSYDLEALLRAHADDVPSHLDVWR